MRHVFILNPAAGKGDEIAPLRSKLESECKRLGADYFIYITQAPGDATEFILRECAEGGMFYGEKCRFYACGGDGTISEVLDGAARIDGAEVGVIPIGRATTSAAVARPQSFILISKHR